MTDLACYRETQAEPPDERLTDCAPLVRRIAYYLMTRMPTSVQVDDLIQALEKELEMATRGSSAHSTSLDSHPMCWLSTPPPAFRTA